MSKITWTRKKGTGANFKVGDRVSNLGYPGTIKAVDKDFQKNINTGCPIYWTKVKFDRQSHLTFVLTRGLKKLNSKKE